MNKICLIQFKVRILLLISVLFVSVGMWGLGYTPTDGGLVVNLERGQKILLSTMIDDDNDPDTPPVEYFVCHYPGKTGGHFGYTNWDGNKGNFLKLFPQDAGATEPATPSIWSIDTALTRIEGSDNFALGGISYTMWSSNTPNSYTLLTSSGNNWKFQGDLTNEKGNANACDVIFVAPTNRSTVTSFDPKKTLTTYCGRTDQDSEGRFNGKKGYGFLGLPYREVYTMVQQPNPVRPCSRLMIVLRKEKNMSRPNVLSSDSIYWMTRWYRLVRIRITLPTTSRTTRDTAWDRALRKITLVRIGRIVQRRRRYTPSTVWCAWSVFRIPSTT